MFVCVGTKFFFSNFPVYFTLVVAIYQFEIPDCKYIYSVYSIESDFITGLQYNSISQPALDRGSTLELYLEPVSENAVYKGRFTVSPAGLTKILKATKVVKWKHCRSQKSGSRALTKLTKIILI
jgi:hypothetical protein